MPSTEYANEHRPWRAGPAPSTRPGAPRRPRDRRPPEDRLLVATLAVAATAVVAAVSAGLTLTSCGRECDPGEATEAGGAVAPQSFEVEPSPAPTGPGTTGARVPPRALAARISAAARAQGTVTLTLTGSDRGRGSGGTRLAGEGIVRYPQARGPREADLSVGLQVGGEQLRTILVGGDLYFAPPLPLAGRTWIRTPREGAVPLRGAWSDAVTGLVEVARPWRAVQEATEVLDAGTLRSDGRLLDRYLLRSPSPSRAPDAASRPAGGTRPALHTLLGAVGPAEVSTELLVDGRGLPRRLVTTVRGATGTSVTTVEYRSWGVRVRIPVPPPAEVVEAETTRT